MKQFKKFRALVCAAMLLCFASGESGLSQEIGDRDYLLVTSVNNNSVFRYDAATGEFVDIFVSRKSGGMFQPWSCIFSPYDGNLLVSAGHFVPGQFMGVLRYDGTTGEFINKFTAEGEITQNHTVTFGPDGNFYVADVGLFAGTSAVLRFQGPTGTSPGAFIDAFVTPGSGGLLQPLGLLFGPDDNGDGHQDLYVNSQTINPHSFITEHGTSSVKLYDGVTGAYIEDFIPIESNGGLEGPNLMTFTLTDQVTLEYLGD